MTALDMESNDRPVEKTEEWEEGDDEEEEA